MVRFESIYFWLSTDIHFWLWHWLEDMLHCSCNFKKKLKVISGSGLFKHKFAQIHLSWHLNLLELINLAAFLFVVLWRLTDVLLERFMDWL